MAFKTVNTFGFRNTHTCMYVCLSECMYKYIFFISQYLYRHVSIHFVCVMR